MRSLRIELVDERVEACLLLQNVHAWRAGGLVLERKMHALVTAVLLRLSGFDSLDLDAEPEPPDREFGEIEKCIGTCEGHPVVRADGCRQAALDK